MEYNLLKTIEPNLGLQMCPIRNPHLTPYPAVDYVNPGLGHAARLFSFYVPLYANDSPYNITKKEDTAISQEGGSDESEEISKQKNDSPLTSSTEDSDNIEIDPIEFNNRKRKLMGDAIQSSFLHPKILTGKINLEPQHKVRKSTVSTISVKSETQKTGKGHALKHKFQFD
jgi:hypothetical protein